MLTICSVNQYYSGSHILRDVSFDVPAGQCTALLGRNGVGKTTLLKCIIGLLPIRSGAIEFEGRPIASLPPYARAKLGIAYVPQGREIFPRLTVAENLEMGLATQKRRSDVPSFVFEMFPVLKAMLSRRGGDLSGGQQQQLAIGRALAAGEMAILLVEQYYDFAKALADRYVVMSRGEVVAKGEAAAMDTDGVRGLLTV